MTEDAQTKADIENIGVVTLRRDTFLMMIEAIEKAHDHDKCFVEAMRHVYTMTAPDKALNS